MHRSTSPQLSLRRFPSVSARDSSTFTHRTFLCSMWREASRRVKRTRAFSSVSRATYNTEAFLFCKGKGDGKHFGSRVSFLVAFLARKTGRSARLVALGNALF